MCSIFLHQPKSKFKKQTLNHIIETIHYVRSKNDNNINFCFFADINKTNISDILDSYGALQQVVTEFTRKQEILDVILTDLHTKYHGPICLPPLQADQVNQGKDSDHTVVFFPPIPGRDKQTKREYKLIKVRPIPEAKIIDMGLAIGRYPWEDVLSAPDAESKVQKFHSIIRSFLDEFFPEKQLKISKFDKKWFCPKLRTLHRKKQR